MWIRLQTWLIMPSQLPLYPLQLTMSLWTSAGLPWRIPNLSGVKGTWTLLNHSWQHSWMWSVTLSWQLVRKKLSESGTWSIAIPHSKDRRSHEKPDVILVDHDFEGTPQWHNVHAVAELTMLASKHLRIIHTVTDKSYIMLGVQPSRVFAPIISVWGGSKFCLAITDCQGQLRTSMYNIHGGVHCADLHVLIHIVAGLCFWEWQSCRLWQYNEDGTRRCQSDHVCWGWIQGY